MPEWWPLIFFRFSNWPGVTRDTFPLLHFPQRSCCREPVSPLFEEVHHLFEVVGAVFPLHVHQDAVRGRLHGDVQEGIDAGVVQDLGHFLVPWRGRGEKWGYERLFTLFYLFTKRMLLLVLLFNACTAVRPQAKVNRLNRSADERSQVVRWRSDTWRLSATTEWTNAGPINIPACRRAGFCRPATNRWPPSLCSFSFHVFYQGEEKRGETHSHWIHRVPTLSRAKQSRLHRKVSFHDRQVKPLLLRRQCATQNKRMNGKGKKDN